MSQPKSQGVRTYRELYLTRIKPDARVIKTKGMVSLATIGAHLEALPGTPDILFRSLIHAMNNEYQYAYMLDNIVWKRGLWEYKDSWRYRLGLEKNPYIGHVKLFITTEDYLRIEKDGFGQFSAEQLDADFVAMYNPITAQKAIIN